MQLFAIISRSSKIKENNIPSKNEEIVEKARLTIYKNLSSVTIRELANVCFLSTGRLSHIFKDITGKSPLEYISEMRLQKAIDMLIHTNLPVGKIALEVGYADQNYFSRIFKKATGMSPGEFRKQQFFV